MCQKVCECHYHLIRHLVRILCLSACLVLTRNLKIGVEQLTNMHATRRVALIRVGTFWRRWFRFYPFALAFAFREELFWFFIAQHVLKASVILPVAWPRLQSKWEMQARASVCFVVCFIKLRACVHVNWKCCHISTYCWWNAHTKHIVYSAYTCLRTSVQPSIISVWAHLRLVRPKQIPRST